MSASLLACSLGALALQAVKPGTCQIRHPKTQILATRPLPAREHRRAGTWAADNTKLENRLVDGAGMNLCQTYATSPLFLSGKSASGRATRGSARASGHEPSTEQVTRCSGSFHGCPLQGLHEQGKGEAARFPLVLGVCGQRSESGVHRLFIIANLSSVRTPAPYAMGDIQDGCGSRAKGGGANSAG